MYLYVRIYHPLFRSSILVCFLAIASLPSGLLAQQAAATGTAEILVVDQTRGAIPHAIVKLEGGGQTVEAVKTDTPGVYRVEGLVPRRYRVTVEADGFKTHTQDTTVRAGRSATINAMLQLPTQEESVNVVGQLAVNTRDSLTGITLTGDELSILPDNEIEMLYRLMELAGGRGRPGDVAIYVDGFRGFRRLPPKEAIELIQVNAEPYSAEFSEPGTHRVEIITKPGSEGVFAELKYDFNDETLNTREPFATSKPALQRRSFSGYLSGPLVRGKWGYTVYAGRWEQDENATINATILDDALNPMPYRATLTAPQRINNVTLSTNVAAAAKLRIKAEVSRDITAASNQGLKGGFNLESRALYLDTSSDVGRFSMLALLTPTFVQELRVQVRDDKSLVQSSGGGTAYVVAQAFASGANQQALFNQRRHSSAMVDLKMTKGIGALTIKGGLQGEAFRLSRRNLADFGGTHTFGADFERDALGRLVLDEEGRTIPISALENYRRASLGIPGYLPTTFTIATGNPGAELMQWQGAAYIQNDWQPSPAFTLSLGARYQGQKNLEDWNNVAPRIGMAWSMGPRAGTLRAGGGLFHDWFAADLTLDTIRQDGTRMKKLIVQRPTFYPDVPPEGFDPPAQLQTIMRKATDLQAPEHRIASLSYERNIHRALFGSVTYTVDRGDNIPRLRDVNAPTALGQPRPDSDRGEVLVFDSIGRSERQELQLALRASWNEGTRLFTNYTYASTRDDGDGPDALPADSRNIAAEFGRAQLDEKHRLFISGSLWFPGYWIVVPSLTMTSGRPFNITTGLDNNGDSHLTDRPAFASPDATDVIDTPYGPLEYLPEPDDTIVPRNLGEAARTVKFDLSISKVIMLGNPKSGRTITLHANGENLLDSEVLRDYNGVLLSPIFGQANTAEPGRRISLGLNFNF